MSTNPVITRFAPSPTGYLHLGHAYSALIGWTAAHETGGRFLLRIEDIDPTRCRDAYIADLMEDLAWLGLNWEEPVRRQSEHMADYRDALRRLDTLGVLYPCFCTRSDIAREIAGAGHAPHGPDGPLYPGTCRGLSHEDRARRLAAGEPHALRLDVERAKRIAGPLTWHDRLHGKQTAIPEILGDVILARKEMPCSYHLAVTVDDFLQGVSLVTRGWDLFAATHVHRLLQALLGYAAPEWAHHPLLHNEKGERLAKRDKSATIRNLRQSGVSPEEVYNLAGFHGIIPKT